MNFRPRWRRREIMGFGEPWRVIHSLPCTNSPVIHPQAPRPSLPVCLPHSAHLTFLLPKCVYISLRLYISRYRYRYIDIDIYMSPPSCGIILPHTRHHVQKEGGARGSVRGSSEPQASNPNIPPSRWKVSVRDPPSHPGSPARLI